jgi:hypothetical protein
VRTLPLLFLLGCSTPAETPPDAETPDAASGQTDGKDHDCADTFGDALTDAFGRVDGTVVAIVEPGNTRCVAPNSDHVIVQVELNGAVYRMVVNVQSDQGDPEIYILRLAGIPLPAPAFSEGWHTGLTFDYRADLDIGFDDPFAPFDLDGAVERVADSIEIGDPISVYASSSGGDFAGSAHLIHRNGGGEDGAIVVRPESESPTWLLFRFADQTF